MWFPSVGSSCGRCFRLGRAFFLAFSTNVQEVFWPPRRLTFCTIRNTFALEAFPPGTVSCARRGHGGKLRGARGRMITLPNTDSKADRRWSLYVLVAVVLVAL